MDQDAPKPKTKERRGPLGCLFTGTLGCGSFLVGAVFAAALGAPQILANPIKDWVISTANDGLDGSIGIERLDLALDESQTINGLRLFDPDQDEVLVATIGAPSILELADFESGVQRYYVDLPRAKLEVDEDGISNLERALGRGGEPFRWQRTVGRSRSRSVSVNLEQGELDLAPWGNWSLSVRSQNARWIDRREPRLDVEFRRFVLQLDNLAARGFTADLDCELEQDAQRARLEGTLEVKGDLLGSWTGLELSLDGTGIPTQVFDRLAGLNGRAVSRFGPLLDLAGEVHGNPQQGARLRVEVDDGTDPVHLEGVLRQGGARASGGEQDGRPIGRGEWHLDLDSGEVPSAWIELWVGALGFDEIFGPRGALAGTLVADVGGSSRHFEGSFESGLAFVEGRFFVDGRGRPHMERVELEVQGRVPAFARALCTWLLPWFEEIEFPGGGRPVLAIESLAGLGSSDLRSIDGALVLELPACVATLTPEFADKLGLVGQERRLSLPPTNLDLELRRGVVHYSEVELPVRNAELVIEGRFDPVERRLALEADGPIAIIARHVLPADNLELFEDSLVNLPMRITGAPEDPEFLGDLDALRDARETIEDGARRLLEGWLDKP